MNWRREDAEPEHADVPRVPAPPERKDKDMAENGEVTIVGTGARWRATWCPRATSGSTAR